MDFRIRKALIMDVPDLKTLIEESVRCLQKEAYTPNQIEGALQTIYGVDTQLIEDKTYFVIENASGEKIACGGWSKRKTLFGGDVYANREDSLLNPDIDAAKIRAFFVHPNWTRKGIASLILEACEKAAIAEGFTRLEMGSTLTGVPFYDVRGYKSLETIKIPIPGNDFFSVVRMEKTV